MRIIFITLWCLLPVAFAAYHFGPGQRQLKFDHSESVLSQARAAVESRDWAAAVEAYQDALAKLPKDQVRLSRQIRLEAAKAKMQNKQLPVAREDLESLVNEIDDDKNADPALRDQARAALANSRYYMTYLMKLEGLPEADWMPEIEAARQEYKLLAQNSTDPGFAAQCADDLESAIRLARMDPAELYGLPIPSQ
jgi:outer membrane protein assembly factor BamD (BamD/ComL family)